ncbi:phospholipase D-like domain-containing protein [Halobiforma nitratireducens]|uniref:Phospholipase-like protein n=1 Tax=Halobiforma nitratireducens JCM 10879 TaxID=1227454 RepID=M0LWW4_9EURY|nr:phospholipase D-like domain-containing protein [Halobiforma nitratireducens]EMA36859.1 phospholipase-like protein [Halobiforma nitratireducens JCM 10879]
MVRRSVVATIAIVIVTVALSTFGVAAGLTESDVAGPGLPAEFAATESGADDEGRGCPHADTVLRPTTEHNTPSTGVDEPRIVELYPNPTLDENVGEFVLLETPPETRLGNWTLTDGHTTASFPNETVSGRVAVSTAPNATEPLTDAPVVELEGTVRLAVDGDDLVLRNGSERVDAVSYDHAPEAERWYRDASAITGTGTEAMSESVETAARGRWWPRDATCRPVTTAQPNAATAFVLPDSPDVPVETIQDADDRLLLAGYTITSEPIAAELVAAVDRGVDVAVLVESGPVGGTPEGTESVVETLEDGGVDVRATGGEGARYRYHHPKYVVADDRLLVTTENWKPAGVGGESSRGWGITLEDEALADDLAAVFETDFGGWDARPGADFRRNATFVEDDPPPPRRFPAEHDAETVSLESAELLLAPDNAERRLIELVRESEEELLIKQASISRETALFEEAVDAARRGVDVRILLDSTWYHEDDNAALVADLERLAGDEALPLEARLVEDTDRFEKIHAKGIVVDGEVAVVGSANWNDNAFENNREVLIAAHGEEAAAFYAAVFEDDWGGDGWTLPLEFSATVVLALVVAAVVGSRYVQFGDDRPPGE